jgi:16S rRNA (guanine966-N2)-methyltransferase
LRIIAGSAKGKRLKAPPGLDTRPITDMIKEALFNIWGPAVAGSKFLDLFAGSGSVGIEALSRGAAYVIFIDNSGPAVKVIKENLLNCGFLNAYEVYQTDVFKGVAALNKRGETFDLIYIDPPFKQPELFSRVMAMINDIDIMALNAVLVLRTPRKMEMPSWPRLTKFQLRNYGESSLHYYCEPEEEPADDGNISDT